MNHWGTIKFNIDYTDGIIYNQYTNGIIYLYERAIREKKSMQMKTIQQVLKETDHKSIESAYFYEYPINLWEVKNNDDITIGEFHSRISSRFQSFLNRLCTMDAEKNPEKQGILFVYKSQTDDIILGEAVGLIHADELMEREDLYNLPTYAYEFTEQKEALSFLVSNNKLTQDNIMNVIVGFLNEVSFFGYNQESLEEETKRLEKSIKESKEHPERLIRFDHEEFCKEHGIPIEEEYPEENEKKNRFYDAGMDYTQYCKEIELQRIKESLKKCGC